MGTTAGEGHHDSPDRARHDPGRVVTPDGRAANPYEPQPWSEVPKIGFLAIDGSSRSTIIGFIGVLSLVAVALLCGLTVRVLAADQPAWVQTLAEVGTILVVSGVLIWFLSAVPLQALIRRNRREVDRREELLRDEAERKDFDASLHRAMGMAVDHDQVLAVVCRALLTVPDRWHTELLLADSSRAHLRAAVQSRSERADCACAEHRDGDRLCTVATPSDCPAVARGQILRFDDSEALDACPYLPPPGAHPAAAVCVPVSVLGNVTGVLHSRAPRGASLHPRSVQRLGSLADQAGARIGMLAALARSERQAHTDALTGLLNRRSLEDRLGDLSTNGSPYALAMGDLDHFKLVNDTYGHEVGDRALRLFADVVRRSLRPDDVVGRYGGEEFLFVFPATVADDAVRALDRLRERLAVAVAAGAVPPFTVSFGVTASAYHADYGEAIRSADRALYQAKQNGRNRVEVANPAEAVGDLTASVRADLAALAEEGMDLRA